MPDAAYLLKESPGREVSFKDFRPNFFLSQRLFLPISVGNDSYSPAAQRIGLVPAKHAGVGWQKSLTFPTNNGSRTISNMSSTAPRSKHLPYEIDPETNRDAFYETNWKHASLAVLLKHLTPKHETVLDYGCGRGETLQIFGAAGLRVTGADVDPECVKRAARFGAAVTLDPDDPVKQFGRKSFDIVTCFHVLEHVDTPKKTLTELAQIARRYVLIAVPNLRYLNLLFARSIDVSFVNEGHLQSWDHWHLRSLAERHCGLELVDWGFDATRLPIFSSGAEKVLGAKFAIWLDTGPFKALFPFHGISVIGLFRVK